MVPIRVHLRNLQGKRKSSTGSENTGPHFPRELVQCLQPQLSLLLCAVTNTTGWSSQPPELRVGALVFMACQSLGVYKSILGGFVKHTLRQPRKVGWGCCMGSRFPYMLLFCFTLCLENLINTTNIKSEKSKD